MKKITSILLGTMMIFSSYTYSQFTVTNTQTVQDLIQNVLAPGVQITNITVNGAPANTVNSQVGYFDDMGTGFPIDNGIVFSTGNAVDCETPGSFASTNVGTGSDVDIQYYLDNIAFWPNPNVTHVNYDAIVVEFDFVALNDTALFNYSFGSEEYNTYVGTASTNPYADVFGFFLSGPGITGPYSNNAKNIALVPATTTEVSIYNINNGTGNAGPCQNCAYFNWNTASPMAFEGYTNVLTSIASPLICGDTYHIKMVLADYGDGSFDTGVFLEAESFVNVGPQVSLTPINPDGSISNDSTIVEGCTEAILVFKRTGGGTGGQECYPLSVGGTATPGIDYNVLPDSVCFPPGVDSIAITITPIQDGVSEGPESITLGTYIVSTCGDTISLNGTIWIIDAPNYNVLIGDTTLTCPPGNINITATTDGGTPALSYLWSTGGTNASESVPPTPGTTTYTVDVTDGCGVTSQGTVDVTVNVPSPPTISFSGGATQTICPGQNIDLEGIVAGNTGTVSYEWGDTNPINPVLSTNTIYNVSPTADTWYYLQVTDNCNTSLDSMHILMGSVNVSAINIVDITSCVGVNDNGEIEIITIPATGFTYDINGGTPNTTTSNGTGLFTGLYNGGYQLHIEDNTTGCFLDTIVSIGAVVGSPPTVANINVTDVTCPGDLNGVIELVDINGTSGNLPFDIVWTPTAGAPQTENNIITTLPTTHSNTGLYGSTWIITISDDIGCASTFTVTLTEPSPINLNLTSNEPLCFGQTNGSVYINATGGTTPYTFTILDSDSTQLNQNNSNAAEQIPTGWYYTSLSDDNSCIEIDSIFLDQPDSLYAILQLTNPLCYGIANGSALVDQLVNNQGPVQYSWSPSTDSTDWARFLFAGNHTVTIVDSVGCIWQNSFTLVDPDSIYINTISSLPAYCRGSGLYPGSGTVSGTAAGGTGTISYIWAGNGATSPSNTWGNRVPGWYLLTATDANNCLVFDSVYVDSLNPVADFTATPSSGTVPVTVTVTDASQNRVTNSWSYYSVLDSTSNAVIIGYDSIQAPFDTIFTIDGDYAICLVVSNDFECYDTMCVIVNMFPIPSSTLPNVFTPNGDLENDTWFPIQEGMKTMQTTILNRWGNTVYVIDSTDPADGWNGTNKDTGKMCSDGVYTFVYTAEAENGEIFKGQGFIHLISK